MRHLLMLLLIIVSYSCSRSQSNSKAIVNSDTVTTEKFITVTSCDSLYISYYPDGKKESEGCIKNGKKEGQWKIWEYQPTGEQKRVKYSTFFNGKKLIELDSVWHERSNILAGIDSTVYRNDTVFNYSVAYFKNGTISTRGQSVNGLAHGINKIWSNKGHLLYEDLYFYGKAVADKEFDKQNGNLKIEKLYDKEGNLQTEKEFDPQTGKLKAERKYKGGNLIKVMKY